MISPGKEAKAGTAAYTRRLNSCYFRAQTDLCTIGSVRGYVRIDGLFKDRMLKIVAVYKGGYTIDIR